MPNQFHSRRLFLAAGSASAVFGALSAVAATENNADLLTAIERHKAASAAVEAHTGDEDVPIDLVDAESEAFMALAETPCVSDGQFRAKMGYMLGFQKEAMGPS